MSSNPPGFPASDGRHTMNPFSQVPARCTLLMAFASFRCLAADEPLPPRPPQERDGAATLMHRAEVVRGRNTNSTAAMRLWPLYASPEARMNYVEVAARSGWHFHPDTDHKLYVLEGRVVVMAGTNSSIAIPGDLIIIPKGLRHCYDVPVESGRALLLTFDAPPYDPKKTVPLGTIREAK